MDAVRLAFYDRPPYAVHDGECRCVAQRGSDILRARNMSISYVHADEAGALVTLARRCRGAAVWGRRHCAKTRSSQPDVPGRGARLGIPHRKRRPGFRVRATHRGLPYFRPARQRQLGLLSLLIVSILTAVIDRSRTRHVPRVLLAMFGSVDLPHDAGPAHWILYIWIALLSIVLMVLYTSIICKCCC
jgi:hypothetical protein